jgi:hypothetical protein
LNYVTVLSFIKFHPDWEINVYTTGKNNISNPWGNSHQKKIDCEDYFSKLSGLPNVTVVDYTETFEKLGLGKLNYIYQSDFVRIYLLSEYGGVWSDFDIVFVKNIETVLSKYDKDIAFECRSPQNNKYYPVGFFVGKKGSIFFKDFFERQKKQIKSSSGKYQKFGSELLFQFLVKEKNMQKYNIHLLGGNIYLPFYWGHVGALFSRNVDLNKKSKFHVFDENTIGVHFFNGGDACKNYIKAFDKEKFEIKSTMDVLIKDYVHLL